MAIETIHLSALRAEAATQSRAKIDDSVHQEYAERMKAGDSFPPLIVFFDGKYYWVADGFHRIHGAKGAGLDRFPCDVRKGTQRDAIEFSLGANAENGLRRTNEDKRQAVLTCLKDSEWRKRSTTEIAKMCRVTQPFVLKIKGECESKGQNFPTVRGADGKTYPVKKSQDITVVPSKCDKKSQDITVISSKQEDRKDRQDSDTKASQKPASTPSVEKVEILATVKGQAIRVPEKIQAIFQKTADIQKQLNEIQKSLDGAYHDLCSHGAGVMVRKGLTKLEGAAEKWKAEDFSQAFKRVKLNLPYAPCPQCLGESCKYCSERGWVTRLEWDGTCAGSSDDQKKSMVERLQAAPF